MPPREGAACGVMGGHDARSRRRRPGRSTAANGGRQVHHGQRVRGIREGQRSSRAVHARRQQRRGEPHAPQYEPALTVRCDQGATRRIPRRIRSRQLRQHRTHRRALDHGSVDQRTDRALARLHAKNGAADVRLSLLVRADLEALTSFGMGHGGETGMCSTLRAEALR